MHCGIEAYIWKARDTLYWPNMTKDIRDLVSSCDNTWGNEAQAAKRDNENTQHFQQILEQNRKGRDLFTKNHTKYLITVDYY